MLCIMPGAAAAMVGVTAAWVPLLDQDYGRNVHISSLIRNLNQVSPRVLDWKRLDASLCRLDVTHSNCLPTALQGSLPRCHLCRCTCSVSVLQSLLRQL